MMLTKYVDASTPTLLHACFIGKHFPSAVVTVRKAGEKPLDYLIYTFTDVIVTSVQTGGSSGGDMVTEVLGLNFAKVKCTYQPQDNKGGKKGGAIEVEYSIAENK
jgi:type VI secretion system secreted protein Hcp